MLHVHKVLAYPMRSVPVGRDCLLMPTCFFIIMNLLVTIHGPAVHNNTYLSVRAQGFPAVLVKPLACPADCQGLSDEWFL